MIFINPHKCCTFVTEKSCLTSNANLCIIQKLKLLPSHYLYWGETLVNRSFLAIRHILAEFSGKILPAGLEIFSGNRRLDLAFPSNPGITFAPRTEMTAWCGSLKDAKMEVNGSGGRLDRKTSKERSVKRRSLKRKGISPEAWNRANHPLSAQKNSEKEKVLWNSQKHPFGISTKRNGPCVISLKR